MYPNCTSPYPTPYPPPSRLEYNHYSHVTLTLPSDHAQRGHTATMFAAQEGKFGALDILLERCHDLNYETPVSPLQKKWYYLLYLCIIILLISVTVRRHCYYGGPSLP